jgi:hypothetical protein
MTARTSGSMVSFPSQHGQVITNVSPAIATPTLAAAPTAVKNAGPTV